MGIASGTISFQRFRITGRMPESVDDALLKLLEKRTFGRLPPAADMTQAGWVGPNHLYETEWSAATVAVGDFAHLALRIDKLNVPGNVLRGYVEQELAALRQSSGRDAVTKFERRKAREAALLRAEKEARDGAFRRSAAYGVLIDLAHKFVYFANTSPQAADRLMAVFSDTFGCALEPEGPARLAHRLMLAAKHARALENLPPARFVKPPKGYSPDEDAADFLARELEFLGKEFLAWIWFKTTVQDAALSLTRGGDVTVMLEKTLRLKCDFGLTGSTMISADHPADLPDARTALRFGKLPLRAGLVLGSALGEFRLVLDATRWVISGMTLPAPAARDEDRQAALEARFEQIADVAAQLDALYELFLNLRTGRDWAAELRKMQQWAASAEGAPALQIASA